jgi:hypothetical protein
VMIKKQIRVKTNNKKAIYTMSVSFNYCTKYFYSC